MKKGKIIGIAVTCLLSASALICGGIFLHQYFDAQNSVAAFDELAGLVVEVTLPAPDVSDAEGEEPSASEAELALEKYGDELLILSTCEYTYNNGRFVVVAKKVG